MFLAFYTISKLSWLYDTFRDYRNDSSIYCYSKIFDSLFHAQCLEPVKYDSGVQKFQFKLTSFFLKTFNQAAFTPLILPMILLLMRTESYQIQEALAFFSKIIPVVTVQP